MTWWQYLLLVNIYLVLFYGFYAAILRKETFFQLNRLYLVSSAILSFCIPVIHAGWVRNLFITQKVQHTLMVYGKPIMVYHFRPVAEQHHTTIGEVIVAIYLIGIGVLLVKLFSQLLSLHRVINEPSDSSFSFFKSIRVSPDVEKSHIIEAHEQAHANQWHSFDILLIELITIINWFNPIVYFYRLGVKHIHEFIADRQALKNGTNKAEYALLLLSQTLETPVHNLVNPFYNHSLLKRRILMLQKKRSQYVSLIKYGFSIPLFVLMLILSSATIIKSNAAKLITKKAAEVFSAPAAAILVPEIKHNTPIKTSIPEVKNTPVEAAQEIISEDEPIFNVVEKEPEFKGGMDEFYRFLSENLRYPDEMMKHNIQGKVFISLTVERDGSLTDIKSEKDIGFGSADEAIRVLKLSPKWEPGYQNGHTVRVRYTLPILFNLKASSDTTSRYSAYATLSNDTVKNYQAQLLNNSNVPANAVYVLDSKVINDIGTLSTNGIESVKVYKPVSKDDNLVKLYGTKALNGVVMIKTKSGKS